MKLRDLLQQYANEIKEPDSSEQTEISQDSTDAESEDNEPLSAEALLKREGVKVQFVVQRDHAIKVLEKQKKVKYTLGLDIETEKMTCYEDHPKNNLEPNVLKEWPRTKTGRLETGRQTLARFSSHPMVKPLRKLKAVSKLLSTYGHSYADHVNPVTGRIHANFRLAGTETGRFSCNSPNIQNPPRSKDFRELFCAPPGRVIVVADYSQIELRVAALVSGDEAMLKVYEDGLDLHRKTAGGISGTPLDEVTKEQRQAAKAINFGLLFGQGAKGLANYARTNYGVEITKRDAEKARKAFFRTYWGFARWQKKTSKLAELEQKVMTPTDRVRDFRKSKRGHRYTEAINTHIQGGAAEVMMAALARLPDCLKGIKAQLANVVHDKLVLEADEEDAQIAMVAVRVAMEEGMLEIFREASTKNLVEINAGINWAEAK